MELFEFKKSDLAIKLAQINMEQEHMEKSYKSLINFMIEQRHRNDDINPDVVLCLIKIILPPHDETIQTRTRNVNVFIKILLDLHKQESSMDSIAVSDEMRKNFESVVLYVVNCIKKIMSEQPSPNLYEDVNAQVWKVIESDNHEQTRIGMERWILLDSAFLKKSNSSEFYSGGFVTLVRMLNIMFEINNYWGIGFNNLIYQKLISDSTFEIFDFKFMESQSDTNKEYYLENCWIILKPECRQRYINMVIRRHGNEVLQYKLHKNNYFQNIIDFAQTADFKKCWWFNFHGELGEGRGPSQEIYIKFSQDIQRYDLDLWIGEPQMSSDGVQYVNSSCGLFPSPTITPLDEQSKKILTTLGYLMAKSMLDTIRMDLPLSKAFCRYLIYGTTAPFLNVNDIVDVLPSHASFFKELVVIMKQSNKIKKNDSLTPEQKSEALSELKYEGRPLEDLEITFTLPGFQDIEMVEGGANKFLTLENVEEYLKLIVWWLFYKGPKEKLECICTGFYLVVCGFTSLLPENMVSMFSGVDPEPWTVKELEENCVLDGDLTIDTPIITFLFKILSKYSGKEQKQFLKFTTSSPKLPFGGLSYLDPKLTIQRQMTNGDPNVYLPQSSTCSNRLSIPNYTDACVLEKKFLQAYQEGDAFSFY